MPRTIDAQDIAPDPADGGAHIQLSAMIDGGRAFSGQERNCFFLNTRDGRFADLSAGSGIDFPDDGRALVPTDWDQDGDLDLWISNRNGPRLRLLRNDATAGNHFLALRLVGNGRTTNRDAIGARVEVLLAGETPSGLPLVQSLRAGEGFLSQSGKWLHFGLGESTAIEALVVRWPDGERESFGGMNVDGRYRLVQGSGRAEAVARRAAVTALSPSLPPVATSDAAARVPAVTLLRAPRLNIRRADGSAGNPGEGRSLLVNLWATWCAPCLGELSEFRDRADDLRAAGVDVLALSVDGLGGDATPGARDPAKVLKELRFPFPSTAATEPLVAAFQEFHNHLVGLHRPLPVPTSFLIDPGGRLAVMYKGPVSVDQLIADLRHSSGTLDERLLASARIEGTLIDHPEVRRAAGVHEGSLHYRYGLARLADNKDLDGATYHFRAALEADPLSAPAARQLALVSLGANDWAGAAMHYERLVRLVPENGGDRLALAQLRARLGQPEEAKLHFEEALRLDPGQALAHFGLAALLAARDEPVPAVFHYRAGLEIQADNRMAANNLAWLLATHRDDSVRDPAAALRLATELNTVTGERDANILDTLGMAQAAAGDFASAALTARRALALAEKAGEQSLATELAKRLALFEAEKPYRELSREPAPEP